VSAASISQDFIDVVTDLMADGADGVLALRNNTGTYNPATLIFTGATPTIVSCKVVFLVPSNSNLIGFEKEIDDETDKERKICMVDYREDLSTGDKLTVGSSVYTITGVLAVNSLGITIFQRLKLTL
jgi:hypothetical protein